MLISTPVYGEEKRDFYKNIDVFLFPTIYQTETEGLVTLEALSAGVPVIAYGRACISENLIQGGIIVPTDQDFVAISTKQLINWSRNRSALKDASKAAFKRARHLYLTAQSELRIVIDYFQS